MPKSCHCLKVASSLAAGKRWLLHMGVSKEKSVSWNACLNWLYILRVEITTGLEENCDGENGDFIVISTTSDVDLQDLASASHHFIWGDWDQ